MTSVSKCSSCGGDVKFSPSNQCLMCAKCQKSYQLPVEKVLYHAIDMSAPIKEEKHTNFKIRCMECGAPLKSDSLNISGKCEYCGSNLIEEFGEELNVSPDGIVPFTFDRDVAKKKYLEEMAGKFFAPKEIKKGKVPFTIESIYIPTYQFRCNTHSEYEGKLEDRDEDSEGNTIYRSFRVRGAKDFMDDDITIECSNYLTQMTLEKIKPFQMKDIRKYDKGYILGYSVEYMNEKMSKVRDMAKQINDRHIRSAILNDYSYDRVSYLNVETKYNSSHCAYVILPTYKISYTYKNKKYDTFMNGQTGKLSNDYPKSKGKIMGFVLAILAVAGLLYLLPKILILLGISM